MSLIKLDTNKILTLSEFSIFLFITGITFSCKGIKDNYHDNSSFNSGNQLSIDTIEALDTSGIIDTNKLSVNLIPQGSYQTVKKFIIQQKQKLQLDYSGNIESNDSFYLAAKETLEDCIVNKLIPHWYGTPWDFNGYTHIPNNGFIACGYFVSTVLLHSGFSLNRYTLAQQNPYHEAVSIQLSDSVQHYYNGFRAFYTQFKNDNQEGLYFAGLDSHVGFLLFRANQLLFIHSSFIDPFCVVIENAAASLVFTSSEKYYIAQISTNRKLLDYWLTGNKINIKTE